jgi:hypothetical protein
MSKKIIQLRDKILTNDKLLIHPNYGDGINGFPTRIIIRAHNTEYDGSQSIKVTHNRTVLPGRTKLIEDNFPVSVNLNQHLFLNDNVLGTYDSTTGNDLNAITVCNSPSNILPRNNLTYFHQRNCQWWCAGDGAINKTVLSSSWDPHSTDTRLFHMIPFRVIKVDETLSDAQRRLYKMEVTYPSTSAYYGYKGYYFKKITYDTSISGINMVVDGIAYTPKWYDTATDLDADTVGIANSFKGDKVQQNYFDMTLNVTNVEFKEWFMLTDKSLGNATISEVGLVTGLDCVLNQGISETVASLSSSASDYETKTMYSEVYDAEMFAHLTFDPYTVARDNATIDFEYRIFS